MIYHLDTEQKLEGLSLAGALFNLIETYCGKNKSKLKKI